MKNLSSFLKEELSTVPAVTGFHLAYDMSARSCKKVASLFAQIKEKYPETIKSNDVDTFKGKDIMSVTGNLFFTYQFVSDNLLRKLYDAAPVTRMRFRKLSEEQQLAVNELCNKHNVIATFDNNRSAVTVEFEPGLCSKSGLTPVEIYLRLQNCD